MQLEQQHLHRQLCVKFKLGEDLACEITSDTLKITLKDMNIYIYVNKANSWTSHVLGPYVKA